ncbi:MAG: PD40 domain-containing protein [Candidatus Coatesbacteria bacterium]|nr:MAG: PD40 domain-containing protein [Candidatus Coatesbacteria bacterium]
MRITVIIVAILSFSISAVLTNADWAWVNNLGSPPNSTAWEFQGSVDDDGDKLFFIRDDGKIYVTEKNGSSWSIPVALPSQINNPGATYPFWDDDNNRLYFVSGSNIYYSTWLGGNNWSERTSVGSDINTSDQERAPVVAGDYLYFSREGIIYVAFKSGSTWTDSQATGIGSGYASSYHNGYLYFYDNRGGGQGGTDCWKAQGSETSFNAPVNLGPEINTYANDGSPTWTSDGKYLFFYSNRSGGHGAVDLYWARYTETAVEATSLGQVKALFR